MRQIALIAFVAAGLLTVGCTSTHSRRSRMFADRAAPTYSATRAVRAPARRMAATPSRSYVRRAYAPPAPPLPPTMYRGHARAPVTVVTPVRRAAPTRTAPVRRAPVHIAPASRSSGGGLPGLVSSSCSSGG